jgi:penicillin-binding protein 1C
VDALAPKVQPETKKPINYKIKVIEVCSSSGNIATQGCPHKTKTWVIPGKTVLKPCHQHQAKTEQFTALKLSSEDFDKKSVESDNFRKNFWFEKVGGRGNLAFILEGTLSSSPLVIISPSTNLNYVLPDQAEIPLFASNLGGSKIFWYVNNSFVGVQLGWHPIFWKAYPGYHQIVAIDQFQNFASVNILVKPAASILGLSLVAR